MVYDLFANSDYHYSNLSMFCLFVWMIGFMWIFWKMNFFFTFSHSLFSSLVAWHYDQMNKPILNKVKGSYLMIMGASFILILGSNLWGLFPYLFGVTTQMVLTFSASLMFWLCFVYSSLEFSFFKFFAGFVPSGSPLVLAPFLSVMELVSSLMRPLTLCLRLSMNITTGHVFISLMSVSSNVCMFVFFIMMLLMSLLICGYLMFESGICFIQGYVFSLLKLQYLSEHV